MLFVYCLATVLLLSLVPLFLTPSFVPGLLQLARYNKPTTINRIRDSIWLQS